MSTATDLTVSKSIDGQDIIDPVELNQNLDVAYHKLQDATRAYTAVLISLMRAKQEWENLRGGFLLNINLNDPKKYSNEALREAAAQESFASEFTKVKSLEVLKIEKNGILDLCQLEVEMLRSTLRVLETVNTVTSVASNPH